MFTKPSLSELLEGIARTTEHLLLPALEASNLTDTVTGVLMVLDRVEAEWPLVARGLIEDNLDIELTLRRVERLVSGSVDVARLGSQLASGADQERALSALELGEHNRRLKGALVWAMEALDLPAARDASEGVHAADREVRELLGRILEREVAAIPVTPPRVNPLSRGGDELHEAEASRMAATLEEFITAETPGAAGVRVRGLRRLAGGASREAFRFDVDWRDAGGEHHEACVMLRQPISSVLESDESEAQLTGTRRVPRSEFRMIRAMERQGIPVPHMLWVDGEGRWLERPFSIGRWVDGESDLSKLGAEPHLPKILEDYVDILARVHTVDPGAAGIDFLGSPTRQTAALEQVELFSRSFDRQRLEDFPALTYTIRWLRKHAPVASRVSVVHGDFRLGNFMWDAGGIVAMLDWEQCHLGDPLEEIAFMYWPLWTLAPLVPIRELTQRYERASGIPVDDTTLAWYRVFIELKMSVVILTGLRSFYATADRQLAYGASTGFGMLRDCQRRVVDALASGGPTVEFGDG